MQHDDYQHRSQDRRQSLSDQLSDRLGRRDGQLDLEGYFAAERERALAKRKRTT